MLYICSIFLNVNFFVNIFKVIIKYFFYKRREIYCIGYYDILMVNIFYFIKEIFLLENCKQILNIFDCWNLIKIYVFNMWVLYVLFICIVYFVFDFILKYV